MYPWKEICPHALLVVSFVVSFVGVHFVVIHTQNPSVVITENGRQIVYKMVPKPVFYSNNSFIMKT